MDNQKTVSNTEQVIREFTLLFPSNESVISIGRIYLNAGFNFTTTCLLQHLISEYFYYRNRKELDEDGYFYNTESKRERWTTLLPRTQRSIIAKLKEDGLILIKHKGTPPKSYFLPNLAAIKERLMESLEPLEKEVKIESFKQAEVASLKRQKLPPYHIKGVKEINSPLPPKGDGEKITSSGVPGKYSDDLVPNQTKPIKPMKDGIVNHWTYQVAELLAETVNQNRGHTPSKTLVTWANQLSRFISESEYSKKRVLTAAAWYANHFGEIEEGCTHSIGIYNMLQFCDKFLQLEATITRAEAREEQDSPKELSATAQAIVKVAPHLAADSLDDQLTKLEPQWAKISAKLKEQAGPYEIPPDERWGNNEHTLYYTHWKRDFTRAMVEYVNWMVDTYEQCFITPNAFSPKSKMFAAYLDSIDEEFKVHLLR